MEMCIETRMDMWIDEWQVLHHLVGTHVPKHPQARVHSHGYTYV